MEAIRLGMEEWTSKTCISFKKRTNGSKNILLYFFSAGDSRAMEAIRAGMEEWTSKTCISFKKRTNEQAYVNFQIGSG